MVSDVSLHLTSPNIRFSTTSGTAFLSLACNLIMEFNYG